MTVDIRAKIYCDLGEVISGGFSDDHAQGTGLIRTRGEVVINGLVRPGLGRTVQLGWKKGTTFSRIPRSLRVLSFFADPFRRTTTVQLGCSLTFLENLKPANEQDRFFYSQETDENKDVECRIYDLGLLPIKATFIAQRCLARLGISGSPNLTNYYAKDRFDLSAGYVSVLSDLLYAEGQVGFMTAANTLEVVDAVSGTSGSVVTQEDIIDIGPINSGEIPTDTVKVRYTYTRYKAPDVNKTEDELKAARWELDEQLDELQTKVIPYAQDVGNYEQVVLYQPKSITINEYDRFDRLIQTTTTTTTNVADVNASYIESLRTGQVVYGALQPPVIIPKPVMSDIQDVVRVVYEYERPANVLELDTPTETAEQCLEKKRNNSFIFDPERDSRAIRKSTYKYVTDMHVAAALSIEDYFYINESNNADVYNPSTTLDIDGGIFTLEEKTIEEYVNKDTLAKYTQYTLSGGSITQYVPAVSNKTLTRRYVAEYKTAKCQQQFNREAEFYTTVAELEQFVNKAKRLTKAQTSSQVSTAPSVETPQRPSATEAADLDNRKTSRPAEDIDGLQLIYGSDASSNALIFDLPLAPDDQIKYLGGGYPGTWSVVPSDVRQKALKFGRTQQKLAFGHRYGFSIQLAPDKMPPYPLGGLVINSAGAYAGFKCNGMSWSFDSNGIICNADALYTGGIGSSSGSYTIWFQVQPGITLLPSVTPGTNPSPAPVNAVTVPVDFDPNTPGADLDWGLITEATSATADWGSITATASTFADWNTADQWAIVPYDLAEVPAAYFTEPPVIPPYLEAVVLVHPVYLEADVVRIDPVHLEVPLDAMVIKVEATVPVIKPVITAPVIVEATVDTTFFDYVTVVHIEADVTATFSEGSGMLFGYVLL